jgi:hypothetical protein
VGFSRWKREITAVSENLPPERRADFELQVGLGCATFGQPRQAEQSLRKALALAEQQRLNEIAFSAEAALNALKTRAAPNAQATSVPSGAERAEAFAEIAEKLHALRAS